MIPETFVLLQRMKSENRMCRSNDLTSVWCGVYGTVLLVLKVEALHVFSSFETTGLEFYYHGRYGQNVCCKSKKTRLVHVSEISNIYALMSVSIYPEHWYLQTVLDASCPCWRSDSYMWRPLLNKLVVWGISWAIGVRYFGIYSAHLLCCVPTWDLQSAENKQRSAEKVHKKHLTKRECVCVCERERETRSCAYNYSI